MTEKFISINAARVVAGGTAVLAGIPNDSAMRAPRLVRVTATGNGCYIKFGVDATVVATVNDIFIQAGDSGIFNVSGCKWFSVLQVSGGSNVSVAALEVGGFDTAATLDLRFTASDTLDSRVTFTRSSSATRFDSRGVMETVSSNAARFDYDPVTLAPKGLLIEEQRTNLLTYSEQIDNGTAWPATAGVMSGNATTAPTGALTAETITYPSGSSIVAVYQVASCSASTAYTFSFYAKLGTLSVNDFKFAVRDDSNSAFIAQDIVPNVTLNNTQWQRVIYTFTTPVGCVLVRPYLVRQGSVNGGTVHIWGAQLEAGAFATSYIPTTTAAATRSADVATMTGANFSNWYNASEGTLYAEGSIPFVGGPNYPGLFAVDDTTVNNAMNLFVSDGGADYPTFDGYSGGVGQFAIQRGVAYTAGSVLKMAGAYKANDFSAAFGGTLGTPDTAGTVPTVTMARIGAIRGNNSPLNGHIRRLSYYPRRLSNAELQGLTS